MDQYLGDGVYLSDDQFQLWLAASDHRNKVIALDRDVFVNLVIEGTKTYQRMGFPNIKQHLISELEKKT